MIRLLAMWQSTEERGATMVEYGIIVALIAAVSIAVIGVLGVDVFDAFTQAEVGIDGAG